MAFEPKALKRFGQNFLKDEVILSQITDIPREIKDRAVIEIGPGRGALSHAILAKNPQHLYAFEIDSRCISYLKQTIQQPNFSVISADALTMDWQEFLMDNSLHRPLVIANLPYNVGSVLLLNWLACAEFFDQFVLMFQKEVALRICSGPNHKNYGRLSVISQFVCETYLEFDVPPEAFEPAPKIISSVVSLFPKKLSEAEKKLFHPLQELTQVVFSKRRKMLRASLKEILSKEQLEKLSMHFDLSRRPEQLSVPEFKELTTFCIEVNAL